jgi:hypothetical protein
MVCEMGSDEMSWDKRRVTASERKRTFEMRRGDKWS